MIGVGLTLLAIYFVIPAVVVILPAWMLSRIGLYVPAFLYVGIVFTLVTVDYFFNWKSLAYPNMAWSLLTEVYPLTIVSSLIALFMILYRFFDFRSDR